MADTSLSTGIDRVLESMKTGDLEAIKKVLDEHAVAYYLVDVKSMKGAVKEEEDEDAPTVADHLFALAAAELPQRQTVIEEKVFDKDIQYVIKTVDSALGLPAYMYLFARRGSIYVFAVFSV